MKIQKVCFFLPSSNRDGAELCGLECLEALKALGMQCHVILPKKGPLVADLETRQISYQIIPYKVWIEPPIPVWKRLIFTLWNLFITYLTVFLVDRRRCDLVITNTVNIFVGALFAKLWGRPHIWYIHEFGYEDHGWRFHLGEKFSLWVMDHTSILCLACSQAVAHKYQGSIQPSKIHHLYFPIEVDPAYDLEAAPDKGPFPLTCAIVGRLQEGKRQEDAIRAIGHLRDQGINVQLWVVGGGDPAYAEFLKNLVAENNLGEQVTFFGQVDSAIPYMRKADVVLLCSRREVFARVVVEAMRVGKPVIGSRAGGTVEQITDGFNGFLYELGNYKELATKIKYLIDHPEMARQMGENARKWAQTTLTRERYQNDLARILFADRSLIT